MRKKIKGRNFNYPWFVMQMHIISTINRFSNGWYYSLYFVTHSREIQMLLLLITTSAPVGKKKKKNTTKITGRSVTIFRTSLLMFLNLLPVQREIGMWALDKHSSHLLFTSSKWSIVIASRNVEKLTDSSLTSVGKDLLQSFEISFAVLEPLSAHRNFFFGSIGTSVSTCDLIKKLCYWEVECSHHVPRDTDSTCKPRCDKKFQLERFHYQSSLNIQIHL